MKITPVDWVNWHKNLQDRRDQDSKPQPALPKTKEEFLFNFEQYRKEQESKNLLDFLPMKANLRSLVGFFFCYLTNSWVLFALLFYLMVFYNIFRLMRR